LFVIGLVSGNTVAGAQSLPVQYKDGLYRGEADSFGGKLVLDVQILEGRIESIVVVEQADTEALAGPAIEEFINRVLEAQSPEIDAVSGASHSVEALDIALREALLKAAP